MDIDRTAQIIAQARKDGIKLEAYPDDPPQDLSEAFRVQDALIAAMDQPVVGWKVGLTSQTARTMMGLTECLAGPMFKDGLQNNPGTFHVAPHDLAIVEAEIGFRMRETLAPSPVPFEEKEVLAAIGTVHPVFELVNKRLPGGIKERAEWVIADGTLHHGLIYGAGKTFDAEMNLNAETVSVSVDGAQVTEGVGTNVIGGPLGIMVWLANHLSQRGKTLNAGDWVATGLVCDVVIAKPGQQIEARFSSLGSVALTAV